MDGGCTAYICSVCDDSYTENPTEKLYHWYGEWTTDGNGAHSAECRRSGCNHTAKVECEMLAYRLPMMDAEDYAFILCPVCGTVNDGTQLTLTDASVKILGSKTPRGEAVLRLSTLADGERILSVGFEYTDRQPYLPAKRRSPCLHRSWKVMFCTSSRRTARNRSFPLP